MDLYRLVPAAAVYGYVAAAVLTPVLDEDLWWHLAVGRWVVENGTVPATDPLSAYGAGRPWVAYSWLFEVVLYGLYAAFGLYGVLAYRVALAFAVVASLHRFLRKREPRGLPFTLLFATTAVALRPVLTERPWLVTILFATWTLDIVLDLREGRPGRRAWLLPFVFVVWANVHIQFVYGLGILALACVAPRIDRQGRGARRSELLTCLCLAATFLNPYGLRLYGVVREYAAQPAPYRVIHELTALAFRDAWDWAVLGLALAAAFALGRRSRLSSFDVLLLGGTAYLSFRAKRDLWFVTLAALAVLTAPARRDLAPEDVFRRRKAVALAGAVTVFLVATAWLRQLTPDGLSRAVGAKFPAGAAAFVARGEYPGPLFNPFHWGGYLEWALPRLPANIDGRTNLHGDERLVRLERTWAGLPGWKDDPELRAAGVVVAHPRLALTELLRLDARFGVAYEDDVAVVFLPTPSPDGRR